MMRVIDNDGYELLFLSRSKQIFLVQMSALLSVNPLLVME